MSQEIEEQIKVCRGWFERLIEVAKKAQDDPGQWMHYFFGYVDSAKFILEQNPPKPAEEEKQGWGGALGESKLTQKYRRKFEGVPEAAKPRKGGYTPEEEANIVKMYNLGHGPGEIGKMVGHRSKATMQAKIYDMIKKGLIEKRTKLNLPPDPEEEEDDGFKTL